MSIVDAIIYDAIMSEPSSGGGSLVSPIVTGDGIYLGDKNTAGSLCISNDGGNFIVNRVVSAGVLEYIGGFSIPSGE